MRRREFMTLLGGAAACPLAARAQQRPAVPVIGFMNNTSEAQWAHLVTAFRQGLQEIGYVEGQNVTIEYRWAEGQYDRLPALAADLARRQVAVIVATGGSISALAAKVASATIPIVFSIGGDPVKMGLIASLNRPGGNLTGVNIFTAELGSKQLALLHELVPAAATIALLLNPDTTEAEAQSKDVQEAARTLGRQIQILYARSEGDIDAAFVAIVERRTDALVVATDAYFNSRRDQLVALAARHTVPTIYFAREFVAAAGLASYGASLIDAYRQVGIYTGKILKGAKPADLPVLQPTKFELVINLKTAKALSLTVPPNLLAIADEVIE
jgi:putative tryptophan/tyrosine transport system substrate-binding protein